MNHVTALKAARPLDPFLRWRLDANRTVVEEGLIDGGDVVWVSRNKRGERWAYAFGEDSKVLLAALEAVNSGERIAGITCQEDLWDDLPSAFHGPNPGHWSLWLLKHPSGLRSSDAVELDLADPRISSLLAHSSSAYIFPGDPRIVRWAGVERDGRLVAVAGHQRDTQGAAHLVSVCTDPGFRGQGLAREALSLLVEEALAEGVPSVFLEMYVDNPPAAKLYQSLGFVESGRYFSWLIGVGGEPPLA